ncbi:RCC1 domain-containing protein [Marinagarivorans algicola]|uniref:RCC1 domain-containing protein n=1 Tax=Marinagarivorans algicola TaxID=1513270 RepID=UPI0006B8BABC|nr:hypothetical protein [Marinagarivorans algicola]
MTSTTFIWQKLTILPLLALTISACTGGTSQPTSSANTSSQPAPPSSTAISSQAPPSSLAPSSSARSSSSSVRSSAQPMSSTPSSSSPPASSSSAASSVANDCDSRAAAGEQAYQRDCTACHGNVPTNGTSQWVFNGNALDVFDSNNDGYKPRGSGASQMLALGDFIALYMPSMNSGVAQPKGDNIAAYLTKSTGRAWCPGEPWPPETIEPPASDFPLTVGKPAQDTLVGLGGYAGCLVNANKKAKCWGGNFMIPNNASCRKTPANWGEGDCISRAVPPKNLGNIIALSGSHAGACAIHESAVNGRNVFCWGAKDRIKNTPNWNDTISTVGGNYFSCGLRSTGAVKCWPSSDASNDYPKPPANLKAKAIAGTHEAVCAIRADDSVTCWGNNPPMPPANLRAKHISVGGTKSGTAGAPYIYAGYAATHHACAINLNDKVVCWGEGEGANEPANLRVKSVAASADSSCAVLLNGQTQCWGPLTDTGGSTIAQNSKKGPQGNTFVSVNASRYAIVFTKQNGDIVRFRDYNIKKKLEAMPATEATDLPPAVKVLIAP